MGELLHEGHADEEASIKRISRQQVAQAAEWYSCVLEAHCLIDLGCNTREQARTELNKGPRCALPDVVVILHVNYSTAEIGLITGHAAILKARSQLPARPTDSDFRFLRDVAAIREAAVRRGNRVSQRQALLELKLGPLRASYSQTKEALNTKLVRVQRGRQLWVDYVLSIFCERVSFKLMVREQRLLLDRLAELGAMPLSGPMPLAR